MSRALERQSPLEWKFIILLYKYVARDDVQEYDGRKRKEKREGGGGKKKEEEEMIKRRVIQSVEVVILGGIVEQVGNEMGYFEPLIFSC